MKEKLDVIIKSIELMEYTMRVTSNRKKFPIKYISLIQRIQNTCMDIYESLMEANRCSIIDKKKERLDLQTLVITLCDRLSCYVELSMNLNIIGSRVAEYWQGKIVDIKYMTIAWRKTDINR